MKPFKNIDEQIDILKSRNLKFKSEEEAKRSLLNYNYYNIINGYKEPFLVPKNTKNEEDKYKEDCYFEHIYLLYSFDKVLKTYLLNAILEFEEILRTKCSYYFSEKNSDPLAYLNNTNYCSNPKNMVNVLKNISNLCDVINRNASKGNSKSIEHYIKNHDGSIPLWVLINSLTFGQMRYFYNSIDKSLQNTICKDFSEAYNNIYSENLMFTPEMFSELIRGINLFRNVCAHGEVLISYGINQQLKLSYFSKVIDNEKFDGKNVFSLICLLKLVLPGKKFEVLIKLINKNLNDVVKQYNSISSNDIFEIVSIGGFYENWIDDF